MAEIDAKYAEGRNKLQEVALRYAGQHGLRPDRVEWVEQGGDAWWLRISTAQHTVKVVFSSDEIADFADGGDGVASSKGKIRNAFASLAM